MTLVWREMEALATRMGEMVIYITSDLNNNDGHMIVTIMNNDY